MRPSIYAICALEDIPSRRARAFTLSRRYEDGTVKPWPIFILRWGKHVRAYENRCPHQGTKLDWEPGEFLDGEGIRIQCGKHGALFDMGTGLCVDGPCQGDSLVPIECLIDDGEICLAGVTLEEAADDASSCDSD
jgi:nitrite reductase/ring-hydroxylating ferredoxin subunit